ncbi:unnamed protein product [Paramecium sonneborni]|uniref:VPS9 domain-containing protein n=1 Tax=Paramecium sonneborni TaxID=65129 RepID=A0A8S1R9Q0_9CILI|nr:unnamed protein product [Paramecium sonneborni]
MDQKEDEQFMQLSSLKNDDMYLEFQHQNNNNNKKPYNLVQSTIQFDQKPRVVQSVVTGLLQIQDEDSIDHSQFMTKSYTQQSDQKQQKLEDYLLLQKITSSSLDQNAQPYETDFINQISGALVQFCISSPATRNLFANQEKVKSRNTLTLNANKIWLENQSECFHCMFDTKTLRILIQCESTKIPRVELLSQFHCNDLSEFVRIFCKLPEVRDAMLSSYSLKETSQPDKYGINSGYSEVVSALTDYMKSIEINSLPNTANIDDMVERYLTRLIYEKLYPKEPTARDIELNIRLKTLEWINDEHLSIKIKSKIDQQLECAAQIINQIDTKKNSVDKLDCILKATQLITDTISQVNQEPASADTVFPAFIRVLILAQSIRWQSNINFIELFINKSRMMSHAGYCFTQLKSAIVWIENVNHEQLKIDSDVFNRLQQEKNVKYGMCKRRDRKKRILLF